MITDSKAIRAALIASVVMLGPLALSAQFQLPEERRSDLLVKTRSIEQPQLSQYEIELPEGNPLTLLPVAGNVYMLAGGPSNVAIQAGDDGVVLVDAGAEEITDYVLQAIETLTRRQVNLIIMTGPREDHFSGNARIAALGRNPTQNLPEIGGPVRNTIEPPDDGGGRGGNQLQTQGAVIMAHEATLNRMSAPTGQQAAYPFEMWPTSTFFTPRKTYYWNGEAIELLNEGNATTDGDVIAFFRVSDVVVAGDVIDTTGYPPIDVERGGTIQGVLEALNDIIEITVPSYNQQGGTKIIPGHGRILNEADVVEYRDMMTIIHDRVKLGIERGMTLDQIKAQEPTMDYDGLYSRPEFTGERLIEVIHQNLTSAQQTAAAR